MARNHSIEGLMKWSRREPWDGHFERLFERHVGMACQAAKIEMADLPGLIGGEGVSALWGCAFEDLVASTFEGRGIAEEYLKRRGWKESAGTRAYIQALGRSVMSLYEVSAIVRNEGFLARDLIRGGEPVKVFERSATRTLKPWDRIAARVVDVLGQTRMSGGVLGFEAETADEALVMIERASKSTAVAAKLGESQSREAVLAGSAFIFSTLWLKHALDRVRNPVLPKLQNSDGDAIEFITLHYPLVAPEKRAAVKAALDRVADFDPADENFWNWLEPGSAGKPLPRGGDAQSFITTMESGEVVLGNLELSQEKLTLSVNSQKRAERGRALLGPLLEGLARSPLMERRTVAQMMADPRAAVAPDTAPNLSAAEQRDIVRQGLTDHYRRVLDEKVPMLGNKSPRQMAKTLKGRARVVAWLKMLENRTARDHAGGPMGEYDFTWMWRELGLEDRRR